MQTGKVKFYNSQKAFGFIIDHETDEEIFVHLSGFKNKSDADRIREGTEVSFDTTEGKKGVNAVNVQLVKN